MEIVNDEFWLKYGKTSVEEAISRRDEAAAKLEKMTLWFWAIYTASFTIGVTIHELNAEFWILLILASPIVFIILTYWACVVVQLPVYAKFTANIPFEIRRSYMTRVQAKHDRMQKAKRLTLLSALSVGVALASLSLVEKKTKQSLSLGLSEKNSLLISGHFPKNQEILIEIFSVPKTDTEKKRTLIYGSPFLSTNDGSLHLHLNDIKVKQEISVSVSWKEGQKKVGLISSIMPSKKTIPKKKLQTKSE